MIGEGYPTKKAPFLTTDNMSVFFFESEGSRIVDKIIVFNLVVDDHGLRYYNWGFGDFNIENDLLILDDKSQTNNGDVKKIFYTVIKTLSLFFAEHPNEIVRIKGSDDRRTKLYVALIARHLNDIQQLYEVKMSKDNVMIAFNKEKECDFILISKLSSDSFK